MEVETLSVRARAVSHPADPGLPAAFERLFSSEYRVVVGIAHRILGDRDAAEDVAQEVFLSFYGRHSADADYAAAWLRSAAAHSALNHLRGARRRTGHELAAPPAGALPDPSRAAEDAERLAHVRAALLRMQPKSAAAVALRASGLSYAEVAEAVDIKGDQIGTFLRRAQEALRKEMAKWDS